MKYARPVDHGGVVRMIDVIEIPETLPSWAPTPDAFLSRIFEPNKAEWVEKDEWFEEVPDWAEPGGKTIKLPDSSYELEALELEPGEDDEPAIVE